MADKKKRIILEQGNWSEVEDLPGEELGSGKVELTVKYDTAVCSDTEAEERLLAAGPDY